MITGIVVPCVAEQGTGDGFIEVNAGLLSVKLERATLSDVLRTVGEQAGVQVTIQGNLGNVQAQAFQGVPLSDGIKRLVQNSDVDLVMIYNRDAAGQRYLKEIRAYERSRSNVTFPLAPPRIPTPPPPSPPPAQSKSK